MAPAKLPEFIKRFREVVARHDTIAGYYGHCSVGCMHIRPLINLKEESEMHKMVSIANATHDKGWLENWPALLTRIPVCPGADHPTAPPEPAR